MNTIIISNGISRAKSLVMALSLFGYPLFAAFSSILSVNSAIAISFRFIILFSSMVFLISSVFNRRKHMEKNHLINVVLFILLILLFSCRLLLETIQDNHLTMGNEYYVQNIYFILFIPCLLFATCNDRLNYSKLVEYSFYILLFSLLLNCIYVILSGGSAWVGRLSTERLNPISFGYLASYLAITTAYLMSEKKLNVLLSTILIIISLVVLILSGSRGPLISLLFLLTIVIISTGNIKLILLTTFIAVCVSPLALYFINTIFPDIDFFSRMTKFGGDNDASGSIRLDALSNGLDIFISNPILGLRFETDINGLYPHNIMVELLMSTGIIGFLIMIIFSIHILIISIRSLRFNSILKWLSFLWIYQLVASMFSGSVITQSLLFSVGLLITAIYYGYKPMHEGES